MQACYQAAWGLAVVWASVPKGPIYLQGRQALPTIHVFLGGRLSEEISSHLEEGPPQTAGIHAGLPEGTGLLPQG